MLKQISFIIFLFGSTFGVRAQNIELGKVYDKGLLYYENGIVTIKIGYQDLKSELERLGTTDWYKGSSLNKTRVDKQIKIVDGKIQELKRFNFSVYKITDASIKYSPDSVLIDLFRKTIGSSLLLQGKALVKYNTKDSNESSITAVVEQNSVKFLSKNNELIFEGLIIR